MSINIALPDIEISARFDEDISNDFLNKLNILRKLPFEGGVYFLYRDSELLYVGRALNINNRVKQHFQGKDPNTKNYISDVNRVDCFRVLNVAHQYIYEAYAVDSMKPVYNKQYTAEGTIRMPYRNLDWGIYTEEVYNNKKILDDMINGHIEFSDYSKRVTTLSFHSSVSLNRYSVRERQIAKLSEVMISG